MNNYVMNSWGLGIPFDTFIVYADDTIREFIHDHIDFSCTEQEFFDMYCEEHFDRFGEVFFLDTQNPIF